MRFDIEEATLESQRCGPLSPPQDWVCGYFGADRLTLSGHTILAVYSDLPRSGIAIRYVISLIDGTLRYITNAGPIHEVAAYRGGFLVGYQGYAAFNTLFYDKKGRVQAGWPSHGRYVIHGEDIRVIESGNANYAGTRLARLTRDGNGSGAIWWMASRHLGPTSMKGGTLYFASDGCMLAASDQSIEAQVRMHQQARDRVSHWRLVGADNRLFTTFTSHIPSSDRLVAYLVRLDL